MTALYYRVVRFNDEYFPGLKLIDCQLRLGFDRVLVFLPVKIILDWLFILMFVTKVNSEPNLPIFWLSVIHRHNKLLNRLRKDSKLQRRNSSILSLNGSILLNLDARTGPKIRTSLDKLRGTDFSVWIFWSDPWSRFFGQDFHWRVLNWSLIRDPLYPV